MTVSQDMPETVDAPLVEAWASYKTTSQYRALTAQNIEPHVLRAAFVEGWRTAVIRRSDPVRDELVEALRELRAAADTLRDEADNFSVSGVYFNEPCMKHKGLALVDAADAKARAALSKAGVSQ